MVKVLEMGVRSDDRKEKHNVSVDVVFSEPITAFEAERIVAEAIQRYLMEIEYENSNN